MKRVLLVCLVLVACAWGVVGVGSAEGRFSFTIYPTGQNPEGYLGFRVIQPVEVIGSLTYGSLIISGKANVGGQTTTLSRSFPAFIPTIGARVYLPVRDLTPYVYGLYGHIGKAQGKFPDGSYSVEVYRWGLGAGLDCPLNEHLSIVGEYGLDAVKGKGYLTYSYQYITEGGKTVTQKDEIEGSIEQRRTVARFGVKFRF